MDTVVESTLKPRRRCCATNCANHDRISRLFRFPRDPVRKRCWSSNCRGNAWSPLDHHRLCEAHFDLDQFELHRADGRKLLKWNAVPTIFSGLLERERLLEREPNLLSMGGCSAPGCKNSGSHGFRMFNLPKRADRQSVWIKLLRRDDWAKKPPNEYTNCQVCEAHFDKDQFELHRADGRKLLKWNAVPTIFDGLSDQELSSLTRHVSSHLISPEQELKVQFDSDQFESHRIDGGKTPKRNTVPNVFIGSEQNAMRVKRPNVSSADLSRSVDHEYTRRLSRDQENSLQDTVPCPVASSTSLQHLPILKDPLDVVPVLSSELENSCLNSLEQVYVAESLASSSVEVSGYIALDSPSQDVAEFTQSFGNTSAITEIGTVIRSPDEFEVELCGESSVADQLLCPAVDGVEKPLIRLHRDISTEHRAANEIPGLSKECIEVPSPRLIPDANCVRGETNKLSSDVFYPSTTGDLRPVLHEFQKFGYLCDTVLIGEDGRVRAHSCILAAASNVFHMTLKSFRKPVEQVIVMPGVKVELLEIVVRFIYTGEIAISNEDFSAAYWSKVTDLLMELGLIVAVQPMRNEASCSDPLATTSTSHTLGYGNSVEPSHLSISATDNKSVASGEQCFDMNNSESLLTISHVTSLPITDWPERNGLDEQTKVGMVENEIQQQIQQQPSDVAQQQPEHTSSQITRYVKNIEFKLKSNTRTSIARRLLEPSTATLCETCGEIFNSVKRYWSHRRKHMLRRTRRINCSMCTISVSNVTHLRRHMMLHTGEKPYLCQYCGSRFRQSNLMIYHMSNHHPEIVAAEPSKYSRQCPHCCLTFCNSSRLRMHIISGCRRCSGKPQIRPTKFEAGNVEYACELCARRFRLQAYLIMHRRVHEDFESRSGQTFRAEDERFRNTAIDPCVCRKCGKQFSSESSRITHERSHRNERHWKCAQCGFKASSHRDLFRHVLLHTGEVPFRCTKCDEGFQSILARLRHEKNYHNPTKAFSESTIIDDGSQTVFVCKVCGKRHNSHEALIKHGRFHKLPQPTEFSESEKPFVCTVCSKRHRLKLYLDRHMRTHTGEKPYACRLCSKTYRSNTDLRVHYRNIHRLELEKRQGKRRIGEELELVSLDPVPSGQSEDQPEEMLDVLQVNSCKTLLL